MRNEAASKAALCNYSIDSWQDSVARIRSAFAARFASFFARLFSRFSRFLCARLSHFSHGLPEKVGGFISSVFSEGSEMTITSEAVGGADVVIARGGEVLGGLPIPINSTDLKVLIR